MKKEYEVLHRRLLCHLKDDIMQYWNRPEMLGSPIGNFPTFADQLGNPIAGAVHYSRMQGRRSYAYLVAYKLTSVKEYLDLGLAGLAWINKLQHPIMGYYSVADADGNPIDAPISVQDLCYTAIAYPIAYSLTGEQEYLDKCWNLIDAIISSSFVKNYHFVVDELDSQYQNKCEVLSADIVSILDFLNALYLPTIYISPATYVTLTRVELLRRFTDSLVNDFYAKGIFWNNKYNRSNTNCIHVDLGHTAKAYGVLLKADEFVLEHGFGSARYGDIIEIFPKILQSATDCRYGWRTDFQDSCYNLEIKDLQWWRHIVINQVAALFAKRFKGLNEFVLNGLYAWFRLDYIDRERQCRGVRQRLNKYGICEGNQDEAISKANQWKSAYHEVEHVLSMCKYLEDV